MRLTASTTSLLDGQMTSDLAKLYSAEFLEQAEQQIATGDTQWVLAKFNGRYIGAGLFNIQAKQLSALTVRDVTRRRGVGRLLVEYCRQQIQQNANDAKLELHWPAVEAEVTAFSEAVGGEAKDEGIWVV
ncbi:acetyl-CoA sensor PanZ family protein [Corallincola platygyrae]|uniref:Acetyl-CoA sensor PanZ family protein n=1 Tax=Corallincola platygyrae TaxID=1193278 RepID=A0ABW4XR65_9GAMM